MLIMDRLPQESAREFAFRVLKENIVSLQLKPGSLVSENEMAMELGISRTPLREALIDLSKVLIIETIPQRGSFVANIDPKMVEEARFSRRVLDKAVIEVACDTASREAIDALEENVHLQEFYLEKDDTNKIYRLDNEFHKLIYTAAKKDIIYDMISNMLLHFDRIRRLSLEAVKDLTIVGDHRSMLDAIKKKDKEKAVLLVEKHLNRYTFDEEQIRAHFPQYFK